MAKIEKGVTDDIIQLLSSHRTTLYEKFHVESLAIFGSVSKGLARPDSDIDILIRYKKTPGLFGFLDLKRYLEGIVGRPVDLVTEGALKKHLKEQILREAIDVA
jgi:predicted nucleotidyltransferase